MKDHKKQHFALNSKKRLLELFGCWSKLNFSRRPEKVKSQSRTEVRVLLILFGVGHRSSKFVPCG
jgi:hypothetical protein